MSNPSYKTTYVRPNKTADIAVAQRVVVAAPASPMPRRKPRSSAYGTFFAALMLMFGAYSLANASATVSYFADTERSVANVLQAMGVGIRVDDDEDIFVPPGGIGVFPSHVALEDESGPLQYKIFAEQSNDQALESVTAFCEALTASTTAEFLPYTGPLLSLETGTTTEMGDWSYDVTFSEDAPGIIDGDTCKLDMVYRAWSLGSPEGTGYQDEERFTVIVHAVVASARTQEEQQLAPLAFVSLFASDDATTTATSTDDKEEETPQEDNDGDSNNTPTQSGGSTPPVDPDTDEPTEDEETSNDDKSDDKDTEKSDTATTTEEVQEESSDEEVISVEQEIITDEEVNETIEDEGTSEDEQGGDEQAQEEEEETPLADDQADIPEVNNDDSQNEELPPEPVPVQEETPIENSTEATE